MSNDLKKLVAEIETTLEQQGGSLDAPAREALAAQIASLKEAVDQANAAEMVKLRMDAMNLLATFISAITNVMSLLR